MLAKKAASTALQRPYPDSGRAGVGGTGQPRFHSQPRLYLRPRHGAWKGTWAPTLSPLQRKPVKAPRIHRSLQCTSYPEKWEGGQMSGKAHDQTSLSAVPSGTAKHLTLAQCQAVCPPGLMLLKNWQVSPGAPRAKLRLPWSGPTPSPPAHS